MTEGSQNGPVLFCFDGSDGARGALRAAGKLITRPVDAVVLTAWETVATRLALAGAFAAHPFDERPIGSDDVVLGQRRRLVGVLL